MIAFASFGQSSKKQKTCVLKDWQFNYNLGFTEFYGDVSTNNYFQKFNGEISFATGISARKYFNQVFGLGVDLWYSGYKSKKTERASGVPTQFFLKGNYFDGNVNLLIDFNSLFWGATNRKFNVYGKTGIGYAAFKGTLTDSISGSVVVSGDTIGGNYYKKGGFVVPVGIGVNYMFNKNWAMNFEVNLRTILNDDVDVWRDGFKYDQLLYTSVGISYFLNSKSRKSKTKKSVRSNRPIKPVKSFDYKIYPDNNSSVTNNTSETKLVIPPKRERVVAQSDVIYRVQIFATKSKLESFNYLRQNFNVTGDIFENHQNGIYRYSIGNYATYNDALPGAATAKNNGVSDAFVVAYKNNLRVRITPEMKN